MISKMTKSIRLLLLPLALACSVRAGTYTFDFNNINGLVPDGDLNGLLDSHALGDMHGPIAHVTLTLGISGGFNGDLYAYLYHRDGSQNSASAILLNRVGVSGLNNVGYANTGFATGFTLDDQAASDVHFYQSGSYTLVGGGLSGTWQPDGRVLDPLSPGVSYDNAPRTGMLSVLNGMDPNGEWALYVADVSSGYESTLENWSLQITTIPEPETISLLGFGLLAGCIWMRFRTK
jgi:subtilisin-like proprotein convertase family protein